jgi:prophage regulatory protein
MDQPMTSGEIAKLLGVSRQRVHQITGEDPTFPAPAATLSVGRVWERADIERWARTKGRLKLSGLTETLPTVAYVPNDPKDPWAGCLYLMASAEGPIISVPGIVKGLDDSEPDTARTEAMIGRSIGPWELFTDGWYADIR